MQKNTFPFAFGLSGALFGYAFTILCYVTATFIASTQDLFIFLQ